jgi:O-antigen/teichoic acid export membrane protein
VRTAWVEIAHASAAKTYSLTASLVVLLLSARFLGPEGRGQVAVITTWVGFFSVLAGLSLGQVALRRLSHDGSGSRLGELTGSLLFLAVALSTLGWLAAAFSGLVWPQLFRGLPLSALILGFLALPFLVWEQYGSSLLAGLGRLVTYNRSQVVGRTFSVVAVLILALVSHTSVASILAAILVGEMIVAMGGIGVLAAGARARNQACRPTFNETRELLRGGFQLHLSAVGTFLVSSANILVLNHYQGPIQAGHLQLASQLAAALLVVPYAASMVVFATVTQKGPDLAWPENRRLLRHMMTIMAAIAAVAAVAAAPVIHFVLGEAYLPSVQPFQWLMLCLLGMTFSTLMTPQWIGRGYFKLAAGVTFGVGLVGLAANFMLIPDYGIDGAIAALVVTQIIAVLVNIGMVRHCSRKATGGPL